MERYLELIFRFFPNLLLNNRDTGLVFSKHVVGECPTLDTSCFQALGCELKTLKRVAHEPAGQQEEQGIVDDQVLLCPAKVIGGAQLSKSGVYLVSAT